MSFAEWLASCDASVALHTNSILRDQRVGADRSRQGGQGWRPRHHEAYRPGDGRRLIDWKASRKSSVLLQRQFDAEQQLSIMAVCDVSASMQFGRTRTNSSLALDCAGLLGLAALRQGYAFGLVMYATDIVASFPPRPQPSAVYHALESLWRYTDSQPPPTDTRLTSVLYHLQRQPPLLACICSDFRMPDTRAALSQLSHLHDTIAILIHDEAENNLDPLGHIAAQDLESGKTMVIDAGSRSSRLLYTEQTTAEFNNRETTLKRLLGPNYVLASPKTDWAQALCRLFLTRTHDVRRS